MRNSRSMFAERPELSRKCIIQDLVLFGAKKARYAIYLTCQSFRNSRQIDHITAPIDRQNAIDNITMKS